MNLNKHSDKKEQGSVLLVLLLISAIMGITLASYLIMANNQNTSVMRSMVWNGAMPVAEAGVEDALQMINKYAGNFETVTNWPSTYFQDKWTTVAPNVYYVRRYLSDTYYDVYVTNSNWQTPKIRSIGYALWRNPYGADTTTPFAQVGPSWTAGRTILPRGVNVETKIDPLFAVAMAAKYTIDFSGKNVNTDSFHSGYTNLSNWDPVKGYGVYPLGNLAKTRANGDVVTDATIINSMSVGNAKIKGQVKTGPRGSVSIGPGGSVGDKAWVEGGSTGIKPGFYKDDMNVLFPDVIMPTGSWLPAVANNLEINGKTYQYVFLADGDYELPGFTGSVYVSTNVTIRLKVTGNVSVTGSNDEIRLGPGAAAKFYMTAPSFKIAGNGIINESGNAGNFYYFGLPTNTEIRFGGNNGFTGAIYAPSAAFYLGGGGSDTFDFIGASVTRTVKMNGHYNFHYDEALRDNGMGRSFVPTRWAEL